MTVKDIMKFIESEFCIINDTPCEICGGDYFAECLDIDLINGIPFDVCECTCSNCGHEKTFQFSAPFIDKKSQKKIKKMMN